MSKRKNDYEKIPHAVNDEDDDFVDVYEDYYVCLANGSLEIKRWFLWSKIVSVKDIVSVSTARQLNLSYWTDLKTNGMCLNNIWWAMANRAFWNREKCLTHSIVLELKDSCVRAGFAVENPDKFLAAIKNAMDK